MYVSNVIAQDAVSQCQTEAVEQKLSPDPCGNAETSNSLGLGGRRNAVSWCWIAVRVQQ